MTIKGFRYRVSENGIQKIEDERVRRWERKSEVGSDWKSEEGMRKGERTEGEKRRA